MFGHRDHGSYLAGLRDNESARGNAELAGKLTANLFGRRTTGRQVVTVYADELASVNANNRALLEENQALRTNEQVWLDENTNLKANNQALSSENQRLRENISELSAVIEQKETKAVTDTRSADERDIVIGNRWAAVVDQAYELRSIVETTYNLYKPAVNEEKFSSQVYALHELCTHYLYMGVREVKARKRGETSR